MRYDQLRVVFYLSFSALLWGCGTAPQAGGKKPYRPKEALAAMPKKSYGLAVQMQVHPEGFLVQCVWIGWPAEAAGLLPGDRIQSLNAIKPSTGEGLIQFMRSHAEKRSDQPLNVLVLRNGEYATFQLRNPQTPPEQAPESNCIAPAAGQRGQTAPQGPSSFQKALEQIQKELGEE